MFKFNKNTELLETIEKQKSQIERYESKLRDVVAAYKGLQNEKNALEASLQALTTTSRSSTATSKKVVPVTENESSEKDEVKETSADATEDPQANKPENDQKDMDSSGIDAEEGSATSEEIQNLKEDKERLQHQLVTLTQSLTTVTAEKSKIVATYQAEKKKLKLEQDQIEKQSKEVEINLTTKLSELENDLAKAREKIREQQEDREQEQSTHSIMLKELQKMLNDERTRQDELQKEIDNLRKSSNKANEESKRNDALEKQAMLHQENVKDVQKNLKKAESVIRSLQEEIAQLKAKSRIDLEKERLLVLESEKRAQDIAKTEEERIANLENKITELCKSVGQNTTDKNKSEAHLQKLKDRITQLEIENTLLAKKAAKIESSSSLEVALPEVLSVDEIKNKIQEYKLMLNEAAQHSNGVLSVDEIFASLNEENDYRKLYYNACQELSQVQEEFKRYKVRAQNVLKSKKDDYSSSTDLREFSGSNSKHLEEIKNELAEVRERHFHLRSYCDEVEERARRLENENDATILKLKAIQKEEMKALEENFNAKAADLEKEMRLQRERTVDLLAEKDRELEILRSYTNAYNKEHTRTPSSSSMHSIHGGDMMFSGVEDIPETGKDPLAEIMSEKGMTGSTLLHYSEQLARKDVTIKSVRRHKKQMELQIRQMHENEIIRNDTHNREIAMLKNKISSLERNTSRESANMEYLKNVLFQFLTTKKDHSAKLRMLQAVTAILHFSSEETKLVLKS